ncbi:hypothetical protein PIB30_010586 [Stylosanthes scabra]|uniref:C-JID domain-containing protein n=1 Tax=Stylosanthes scabra TaxID=79078 RepID=A0ABU6S684_9FABA|nr:hypothetical protein [Stylosanthes scabra]
MSHLKLLILREVNFSGCLDFLSNELGYLDWEDYPFTCLPSSFQPNKLVNLMLHHSNIKELWQGIKDLHNLERMELCHSKNLVKIPDLSQAPNLKYLNLKGCVKLVHLDASIGSLEKLHFLNLENCENLLLEKPRQREQLLNRGQMVERHVTSSIYKTLTRPLHHFLSSRRHPNSVGLLVPCFSRFPALTFLDISFCNLLQIPDAIGQLRCLQDLNIGGNNIVTLPHCIEELPMLRWLNLEYCKHLKWLPSTLLPKGGKYGGIYVFNCPNLSDTESCRLTAISWMIKLVQVNMQCSFHDYVVDVVIPGSKIPRWFHKQNTGDSVSLDPSPILDDNNWIGIACCVILAVHDTPTQFVQVAVDSTALIYCGFRRHGYEGLFSKVPIHFKKDLTTTELDHMLLMFVSREIFISRYIIDLIGGESDLHVIGLAFATMSNYPKVVEVKSCGCRWVFKQDLEQLNPAMMFSASSSSQDQKHKFLAIQDHQ